MVADITKRMLTLVGVNVELNNFYLLTPSADIEINDLCSGVTELAVIFASIMASYDVELRKRFFGVFFGFLVVFLINPLRITATILIFQKSEVLGVLVHDFLFRISLIVIVLVYYVFWYNISVKK